ncbi:MAG: FemAB family XrtA/PEP-CTERM system-associated protein [Phycisphaerae bacterium]
MHRHSRRTGTEVSPTAPRGTLKIIPFDSGLSRDWEAYLQRHPDGTFFHGSAWKKAVERTFGHRFRGLIATRGSDVAGILPLFEVRSILAGRLLVSIPYATYGGILADDAAVSEALFDRATVLAGKIGARSIELRSIRAALPSLETQRTHATFFKPLPRAPDRVDATFPRKARAAARRADERHRLTVVFGDAYLPDVWRLYARSMRRLGSPNYPARFFEALARSDPGNHVVQLVRYQDRPVAGLLTFLHRDRVMPYFAGVDERADLYGLSHFLYRESMRWGVEKGYRIYDFGRTRLDNAGPFNFKRLCGFEPMMLEYQTAVMPGYAPPDLSPTSTRWKAARTVWQSLPLTITRPLGSWLARSIPG